MDTATIIGLILGIWGAGLSTYVAIRQWKAHAYQSERDVSVRTRVDSATYNSGTFVSAVAEIEIANLRPRPIQIVAAALVTDDGQSIFAEGERKTLGDGESVVYTRILTADQLAGWNFEAAWAKDATSRYWTSGIEETVRGRMKSLPGSSPHDHLS